MDLQICSLVFLHKNQIIISENLIIYSRQSQRGRLLTALGQCPQLWSTYKFCHRYFITVRDYLMWTTLGISEFGTVFYIWLCWMPTKMGGSWGVTPPPKSHIAIYFRLTQPLVTIKQSDCQHLKIKLTAKIKISKFQLNSCVFKTDVGCGLIYCDGLIYCYVWLWY